MCSLVALSPASVKMCSLAALSPASVKVCSLVALSPASVKMCSLAALSPASVKMCSLVALSPASVKRCSLAALSPASVKRCFAGRALRQQLCFVGDCCVNKASSDVQAPLRGARDQYSSIKEYSKKQRSAHHLDVFRNTKDHHWRDKMSPR
jgi:hypothetical protein